MKLLCLVALCVTGTLGFHNYNPWPQQQQQGGWNPYPFQPQPQPAPAPAPTAPNPNQGGGIGGWGYQPQFPQQPPQHPYYQPMPMPHPPPHPQPQPPPHYGGGIGGFPGYPNLMQRCKQNPNAPGCPPPPPTPAAPKCFIPPEGCDIIYATDTLETITIQGQATAGEKKICVYAQGTGDKVVEYQLLQAASAAAGTNGCTSGYQLNTKGTNDAADLSALECEQFTTPKALTKTDGPILYVQYTHAGDHPGGGAPEALQFTVKSVDKV